MEATRLTMELELYQQHNDIYILPKGRIVLENVQTFKETSLQLVGKGTDQVIIDLSNVDFIDSAGLSALVSLKWAANKSRTRIILLQPSKSVADVLFISKLDGIFDIMTGAEAEMMKAQLVQPRNRLAGAGSGAAQQSPGTSSGPLPRINTAVGEGGAPQPGGGAAPEPGAQQPAVASVKEQIEEHFRKASEHMRQGKFELSVQEYQAALKLDPEYLPAMNNLAVVYEKRPSWHALAVQQWEQVLRLSQRRGDQKHVDRAQRHMENLEKMA